MPSSGIRRRGKLRSQNIRPGIEGLLWEGALLISGRKEEGAQYFLSSARRAFPFKRGVEEGGHGGIETRGEDNPQRRQRLDQTQTLRGAERAGSKGHRDAISPRTPRSDPTDHGGTT
jgi:hypothetical protein